LQLSRDVIVPVSEDGRRHHDIVSHDPANGMPARIDLGFDLFDDNPVAAARWLHRVYPSTAVFAIAAQGTAKAFVAWMQGLEARIASAAGEDGSHMQARSPSKESMTYSARIVSTRAPEWRAIRPDPTLPR
jgi:hypothetical protein